MSDGNFGDYISRERDRLQTERDAVITQQRELDQRLAEINREFQAVDAYEAAKSGKAPSRQTAARSGGGMQRARRGSKREALMELIKALPV